MKNLIMILLLLPLVVFSFEIGIVSRVVDGDTLKVEINGKEETIRLCGVDTPESVKPGVEVQPGALEASEFTKQLTGKTIILTYDSNSPGFFGRLLAYVWIESDNGELICWNIALIKAGYSELYTKYKFDGVDWFREEIE